MNRLYNRSLFIGQLVFVCRLLYAYVFDMHTCNSATTNGSAFLICVCVCVCMFEGVSACSAYLYCDVCEYVCK